MKLGKKLSSCDILFRGRSLFCYFNESNLQGQNAASSIFVWNTRRFLCIWNAFFQLYMYHVHPNLRVRNLKRIFNFWTKNNEKQFWVPILFRLSWKLKSLRTSSQRPAVSKFQMKLCFTTAWSLYSKIQSLLRSLWVFEIYM